ncbi:growth-regulating factor 6-like [Phalaenopsis equestris]|uniref:growth-regulating factor 6-like n=1 Tax=Phalaenopsis equestris TaxID=78828 RepID=UPI0009E3FCE4|nr:growth-regulating factor 6-like [Phalaenopsis equestris]
MEYGGSLSMDVLAGVSSLFSSGSESSKQWVLFESGLSKREPCDVLEENEWTRSKMAAESSKEVPCFLRSSCSHSLFPDGEKMLSFSSRKSDAAALNTDRDLQFYHHPSVSFSSSALPYLRSAEMGLGSSNFDMLGIVAGMRGPFTPSQWVELEHQILIYQYIDAKVPIPSSLLIPIRRSLNLSVFPIYSAVSCKRSSSSSAWGTFHPGFSGSSDPEPGRCHRTDGKKWRCSRDAIADQKYCERHLNRVRHRSRKHVEAHNGRATKAAIPAVTSTQSASAASGDNSSNNLTIAQQHRTSFQPSMTKQSPVQCNRLPTKKEITSEGVQSSGGLPMLPNLSPKSRGTLLPILKQQKPYEGTSAPADFGLICTDPAVNLQGTSHSESISFAVPDSEINDLPSSSHYLVHFFDDLPNNPSECSTLAWSDVDEMQSDRTQLSISIPMPLSDKSSSSSPNHVKQPISPLRHSCDFNTLGDSSQRYPNWVPISWEPSIGGPLGEVLTNKSTTAKDLSGNLISSSSMSLLLIDGWSSNPMVDSSPTAVLQKTSFGSLSSSGGSSPRAEIEKDGRNET